MHQPRILCGRCLYIRKGITLPYVVSMSVGPFYLVSSDLTINYVGFGTIGANDYVWGSAKCALFVQNIMHECKNIHFSLYLKIISRVFAWQLLFQ